MAIHQQAASHPAFWQNITMATFKKLIKLEFSVPPIDYSEDPDCLLSLEEKTFCYVAGHVRQKIHTNFKKSTLEGNDILCHELCQG